MAELEYAYGSGPYPERVAGSNPAGDTKKMEKSLRIIPLGGLGEVGRNMTLFEFEGKILILDMGFKLPEEDMPGIDYVIPNINYLKGKEENILGIVFTHGHYDHIGAVPYLIEKIWRPDLKIFASALTRAIILRRQEDFPEQPKLRIREVRDQNKIKLGPFEIEFLDKTTIFQIIWVWLLKLRLATSFKLQILNLTKIL